jgi:hypothetical protein
MKFIVTITRKRKKKGSLRFSIGPVAEIPQPSKEPLIMLKLTDSQKVTLTLDPRNAKGNSAALDGIPQWANSNPAVAALSVSSDGLTATATALTPGSTQITVVADADLDEGELREITGTLDLEVQAGEAVSLGLIAGTPTEQ